MSHRVIGLVDLPLSYPINLWFLHCRAGWRTHFLIAGFCCILLRLFTCPWHPAIEDVKTRMEFKSAYPTLPFADANCCSSLVAAMDSNIINQLRNVVFDSNQPCTK